MPDDSNSSHGGHSVELGGAVCTDRADRAVGRASHNERGAHDGRFAREAYVNHGGRRGRDARAAHFTHPAHKPTARRRPPRQPAPQVPGRIVLCALLTAFTMLLAGTFAPLDSIQSSAPSSEVQADASYTLGAYSALSQSTDGARVSNMAIAARDLDGTQIAPGQTISLNELLGNTSDDRRYSEAPAFNGEGTVAERGGGVCQVSSAIYVAALQAGLSIVERHAHSVAVDYVPVGLDATLSYGGYDLKICNDYAQPVVLHVQSDGQTVAASILCASPQDSAELERRATSEVTGRYTGYADDSTRTDFYDVTAYLVTYRAGQKESKVEISSDSYQILSGSNTQEAAE